MLRNLNQTCGGIGGSGRVLGINTAGVLAENIPSTGTYGAGYAYPSLNLPTDNGKDIRGLITTAAAKTAGAGSLTSFTAYEDTSFDLVVTGDCTIQWTWSLYVDGVLDTAGLTGTVTIGSAADFTDTGLAATASGAGQVAAIAADYIGSGSAATASGAGQTAVGTFGTTINFTDTGLAGTATGAGQVASLITDVNAVGLSGSSAGAGQTAVGVFGTTINFTDTGLAGTATGAGQAATLDLSHDFIASGSPGTASGAGQIASLITDFNATGLPGSSAGAGQVAILTLVEFTAIQIIGARANIDRTLGSNQNINQILTQTGRLS